MVPLPPLVPRVPACRAATGGAGERRSAVQPRFGLARRGRQCRRGRSLCRRGGRCAPRRHADRRAMARRGQHGSVLDGRFMVASVAARRCGGRRRTVDDSRVGRPHARPAAGGRRRDRRRQAGHSHRDISPGRHVVRGQRGPDFGLRFRAGTHGACSRQRGRHTRWRRTRRPRATERRQCCWDGRCD